MARVDSCVRLTLNKLYHFLCSYLSVTDQPSTSKEYFFTRPRELVEGSMVMRDSTLVIALLEDRFLVQLSPLVLSQ